MGNTPITSAQRVEACPSDPPADALTNTAHPMNDLQALHRRLVNALLAIAVIVLPFISYYWPDRFPNVAVAGICLLFVATIGAHATGRLETDGAARLLIIAGAALVVGGSLLQVLVADDPAATWIHETRHVGRALMITTGGLYVTMGQRRGRRSSLVVLFAFTIAALTVFGSLSSMPAMGAQTLTPLLDVLASAVLIAILFDVTAANAKHLALSRRSATRLAEVDALTNVNNRHGAEPAIRSILDRPGDAALVMLDLDHFKMINDTHGHAGGDHILREVGQALVEQTRASDVVGRWGGEEFVVVVRGGGPELALRIAERVRLRLHHIRADFPISASFGVALVREGDTSESLLKRADSALYRAKRSGRDRVVAAWVNDDLAPTADAGDDVTKADPATTDEAALEAQARALSESVMDELITAARRRQSQN